MTTTQDCILAIDLGTSGPKSALVDTAGVVLDHAFAPTPVHHIPGGGAEQDPEDWWRAIKKTVHRLLKGGTVAADRIKGIVCTSQWSGTVAIDRDGRPLHRAIIWMDTRGAPYADRLTRGRINVAGYSVAKAIPWIRLAGGLPSKSGKDPIAHIHYIKNRLPEVYEKTFKFLEPKDYLNFRLTGLAAASYDSIALHWVTDNRDLENVRYDCRLLRLAGIEVDRFPVLKRAVDILGPLKADVAEELGLSKEIPVVMGTPDVQSAAIGSGAVDDYDGHLYLGTSSWLTCHVPFKKIDAFRYMASLPSAIPDRYLVANEQEAAGACVQFLRDNLFFPDDELKPDRTPEDVLPLFNRLASQVPPGSDRLIFTPWIVGERTPIDDPTVRGAFFNITMRTTRSHMVRSVFEGVALNSRWLLEAVEGFVKRPFEHLHVIGGGATSDLWCQIHADVLDRPMKQLEDPILANVRGAALLGLVALGYTGFDRVERKVKMKKVYEPVAANRALYDELFEEYVGLYRQNRKTYSRLNRSLEA